MSEQFERWLRENGPCSEALEWLRKRTDERAAWDQCPRGDWLLWAAARRGVSRQKLVLAACACARLALRFLPIPTKETRPLAAIEVTEKWARGEATIAKVRKAKDAAWECCVELKQAAAYAAAYAAYAAAYAAAYGAYAADDAAADAAAAAAAYAATARKQMQKDCADAVRAVIAFEDVSFERGRI